MRVIFFLNSYQVPLMHTVLNLFVLLLGTVIEEKHMLMSVVGSAVFKMHVLFFSFWSKGSFICQIFRCALLKLEDLTRFDILLAALLDGLQLPH